MLTLTSAALAVPAVPAVPLSILAFVSHDLKMYPSYARKIVHLEAGVCTCAYVVFTYVCM